MSKSETSRWKYGKYNKEMKMRVEKRGKSWWAAISGSAGPMAPEDVETVTMMVEAKNRRDAERILQEKFEALLNIPRLHMPRRLNRWNVPIKERT